MKFLTLILAAVMTLALSLPAEANLTEDKKCRFKSQMLVGKFANCLAKAEANVTKGKRVDTAADDLKCISKYNISWGKNRDRALTKGAAAGEDMSACSDATTDAKRDGAAAATSLAADRELTDLELTESDLLANGSIQEVVDAAVAAVDITSDNAAIAQATCTDAGGTWGNIDAVCRCAICPDVNECDTNNGGCASNATCQNGAASGDPATCTCPAGTTDPNGDGSTCPDVNECDTNNGGCASNATCQNNAASGYGPTCTCPAGTTDPNGSGTTDPNGDGSTGHSCIPYECAALGNGVTCIVLNACCPIYHASCGFYPFGDEVICLSDSSPFAEIPCVWLQEYPPAILELSPWALSQCE
jgi:hypothetical protein